MPMNKMVSIRYVHSSTNLSQFFRFVSTPFDKQKTNTAEPKLRKSRKVRYYMFISSPQHQDWSKII